MFNVPLGSYRFLNKNKNKGYLTETGMKNAHMNNKKIILRMSLYYIVDIVNIYIDFDQVSSNSDSFLNPLIRDSLARIRILTYTIYRKDIRLT